MTGDARRPGRQANASEILAVLRRDHPQPLREQLEVTLREAIRTGRLPANHRLPSSRTLAADLGISRGVVTEAYTQLAAEGYLTTRARSSVTVTSVIASTGLVLGYGRIHAEATDQAIRLLVDAELAPGARRHR